MNKPPEIPEARSGIWSGIPWVHLALGTLAGLVTFLLLDPGLNLATGMRTWLAVFMGSLVFWVAEACFDPYISWVRREYPLWTVLGILALAVLTPTVFFVFNWFIIVLAEGASMMM
ncbi:MAG: hypothetical protein EA352_10450 [Gemmatimonadales bacterium]|nr:MAG: hypothetical protein EA352_10450 [Gemmatimonadales bacterium]